MRPDERDAAYVWDMVDAARMVRQIVAPLTIEDYLQRRTIQLAIERSVEIIGEAARKVSDEFRNDHPEIPWKKIIAQRHVLAHEYGEIRQDRMWRVATVHIPELIVQLEPLLPEMPQDDRT